MKIIVVFTAVLLIGAMNCAGQDVTLVERYLTQGRTAATDSARAHNLWQAGFNSAHADPKRGLELGREALGYALRTGISKLIADCHNSIGYCFDSSGSADSALHHYHLSIDLLTRAGYLCESAGVHANIGTLEKRRNQLTQALEAFLKAYEIQKNCPDLGYHGSTLYSIGACYNAMENYTKSLEYFGLALQKEEAAGNRAKQGLVHNGMANAYSGLGMFEKSIAEFRESLRLQPEGNKYEKAYAFEGMSQVFDKMNQMDSAVFYCSAARDIFLELNVPFDLVYESTLLAGYYVKMKRWEEAEHLLLETLPVSVAEDLPYDRLNILASLAEVFEQKGEYRKAFEYLDMSMNLRDSLELDEQKAKLAELAGKYETEARDRQIALEKEKNQRLELQKYVFLGGSIVLFLFALILINRYLSKRRSERELAEKNVQIEREKRRAEESEKVKQQFLANMSHEIRTPMNAITGLARRLKSRDLDEQSLIYADAIHRSGEHLMVILNDILDLARLEAGKMSFENIAFSPSIELKQSVSIFEHTATEKGIRLLAYTDGLKDLVVKGDPSRVAQVLNNLVSNAVKFATSGAVTVEAKVVAENSDRVTIRFAVSDQGPGIPEEKQKLIFESFTQANISDARKYGGTGLGLTIASQLVRLMGGDLELHSVPGKGSTFGFELNFPRADVAEVKADEEPGVYQGKFHVLVAEDNDYNFLVTADTFRQYFPEITVHRALNGKDAVAMLEEDEYDLVFMDIQMPMLDGYEATRLLRQMTISVPVIGFTASVVSEDIEKCFASGMNAYLMKPFKDSDFVQKVTLYLGLKGKEGTYDRLNQRELFARFMPARILELEERIRLGDEDGVRRWMHQVRPQLRAAGFEELSAWTEMAEKGEGGSAWHDLTMKICNTVEDELNQIRNGL